MRRFLNGTQEAWDELARRASRACVVVSGCVLPPGCHPSTARIGFEIHPAETILFVDKGIQYDGNSHALDEWLRNGELRFPALEDLRNWLRREVGSLFRADAPRVPAASALVPLAPRAAGIPHAMPADLTELDAVTSTAAGHAAARIETADLIRELGSRVFGQNSALDTLACRTVQHVRRARPQRPATLFALGPTGVGKTSAAQSLAESLGTLLDGRWSSFIRLNMNEYAERHRVSQLLGAPPSYIGYGDVMPLTHGLAAQPESVVLFDEIDKAHPDILITLMSAMDAGELPLPASADGIRTVDCRRAVFFFTSNVNVSAAIAELDATGTSSSAAAICRRHLITGGIRPELVGRISSFLVFRPLSERARAEIATAAIAKVAAEYGLQVAWVAPEVVSLIVSRPYDNLGARPDEYYIDELLGPEFSRYAIDGGRPTVSIEATPDPVCLPAPASGGLQVQQFAEPGCHLIETAGGQTVNSRYSSRISGGGTRLTAAALLTAGILAIALIVSLVVHGTAPAGSSTTAASALKGPSQLRGSPLAARPPRFTSASTASFAVGAARSFEVAVDQARATIAAAGPLPRGVTYSPGANGTGILSGTPRPGSGGAYAIRLTATDSAGAMAQQLLTITVNQAPSFTSGDTIWGTVLINVDLQITTTGYPAPQITLSGTLPSGLHLTDHGNGTATISGRPEPSFAGISSPFGLYKLLYDSVTVSVTATNSSGSSTQTIALNIFLT
jgi:hypothetical protein